MTDEERSRVVLKLATGEVEVDSVKWATPVTRGELFRVVQHLRSMAYLGLTHANRRFVGDSAGAQEAHDKLANQDRNLMEFLVEGIEVKRADGE